MVFKGLLCVQFKIQHHQHTQDAVCQEHHRGQSSDFIDSNLASAVEHFWVKHLVLGFEVGRDLCAPTEYVGVVQNQHEADKTETELGHECQHQSLSVDSREGRLTLCQEGMDNLESYRSGSSGLTLGRVFDGTSCVKLVPLRLPDRVRDRYLLKAWLCLQSGQDPTICLDTVLRNRQW